jgi:hypothetical protein
MRDVHASEHVASALTTFACRERPRNAVGDVLFCRHVRKEGERLENVCDTSSMNGELGSRAVIEPDVVAERDASAVRANDSRNAFERAALTGTGRAEENGHAGWYVEGDVERERTERESDADV